MSEMETTIGLPAGLADDPKMMAVIVNQAVPGTTDGLGRRGGSGQILHHQQAAVTTARPRRSAARPSILKGKTYRVKNLGNEDFYAQCRLQGP
jgi:hypothetical protein